MAEENAWREELTSVENRFKVERERHLRYPTQRAPIFESGEANEESRHAKQDLLKFSGLSLLLYFFIFDLFPRSRDDEEISTFRTSLLN